MSRIHYEKLMNRARNFTEFDYQDLLGTMKDKEHYREAWETMKNGKRLKKNGDKYTLIELSTGQGL